MKKNKKGLSLPGKSYWLDIAAVSALIALGVIAGGVNFIAGNGDELTFANIFFSLIYIAAWAVWGCVSLPRRNAAHPTRVFYTVWLALSALAALLLLILSLAADSASFMSSAAGSTVAVSLLIIISRCAASAYSAAGDILQMIF